MISTAKILVPDQEWLVTDENQKIGSISKNKKGFVFHKNGKSTEIKDTAELNSIFGSVIFEESLKKLKQDKTDTNGYQIYDFPCSSKPYEPIYNVKKKLPLFAKSDKSKSQYCAGYYVIKFRKGWVKSFCPKLITLERYPFHGPYKTEAEMKNMLNYVNKI